MTTNQNPFLTTIVSGACDQARVYYLDSVQRKQQFGGTPIDLLEESLQEHRAKLEMWREEALKAAFAGDVRNASIQLAYIVTGWSLYKADEDLIHAVQNGLYLDPANPDTVADFVRTLQHSVVFWATELQNTWIEGDQQRKTDQANLYVERNQRLYGVYHQVVQDQGSALNQAHQHMKQHADMAMDGVKQAQQGATWMMKGVEDLNRQHQQWMQQGMNSFFTYGTNVAESATKLQSAIAETSSAQAQIARAQAQSVTATAQQQSVGHQVKLEAGKLITRAGCVIFLLLSVPVAVLLAWEVTKLTLGIH
jgi:hypothetical protein